MRNKEWKIGSPTLRNLKNLREKYEIIKQEKRKNRTIKNAFLLSSNGSVTNVLIAVIMKQVEKRNNSLTLK